MCVAAVPVTSRLESDDLAKTIALTDSSGDATAPETIIGAPLIAGRYQILGLVGRGGMGAVYKARDTELDEVVALKMLSEELGSSQVLIDRFKREVKLARRVTHENVARMFDIGEHGGARFLTMEFIEGEALGDLVARVGRLPVAKVLDLAAAVCAGLAAAHRAGVVHRDLKPDNVMLARDGRVLITDFGIARDPVSAQDGKTMGLVVGTPAYMAPEQVEARPEIDSRADIYALGVMLFELLAGDVPWQGGSAMAVAAARLYAPPPDVRSVRPDIPPGIAAVVLRCMAKDPNERFKSADEVGAALAAASPTLPEGASLALPSAALLPSSREKTVAVLPFKNLGPREDDYVADGLTDDLIDTLSMTAGLRVRPRGAVSRFTDRAVDPREVGRELGVEVVVEGSVRKAPSMVRLSARAISVDDGFQLWAQRFDRPANDLLVVSDETAKAVAQALTLHAVGRERARVSDPVAIDLYLRARAELRKIWPRYLLHAQELFQQAHARAPDDASILAGYARTCARLWFFGSGEPQKAAAEARSLSDRALAASPNDADALLAAATVRLMDADPRGAAEFVRKALAAAPDNLDAHEMHARLVGEVGRPEDALAEFEAVLSLDPRLANSRLDAIRMNAFLGRYDRSIALLDASLDEPELAQSEAVLRVRLATWNDAVRATLTRIPPPEEGTSETPFGVAKLLRSLISDQIDLEELEAFRRFVEVPGRSHRFHALMNQLATELLLFYGQPEESLDHLEAAVDHGLFDLVWLDHCPLFPPIRHHQRFAVARAVVAERARDILDALQR